MNNKEIFLEKYQQFEDWVGSTLHSNVYNAVQNTALGMFSKDLDLFRQVRNIIAHNGDRYEDRGDFITISDALVEHQDKILTRIMSSVLSMAIPMRKIYSCVEDDYVLPTLRVMHKCDYTHIPILDEYGHVQGVFSENSVVRLMADGYMVDGQTKFYDIPSYINRPLDEPMLFDFMSIESTYCDCMKMFSDSINDKKRLDIIFITDDGTSETPLRGLITTWDVAGR